MRRIIIAASAVALLAGCGSEHHGGFYNMTTLEQSVQSQVNTDPGYSMGSAVDSCSMVSGQTAECIISDVAGSTSGITVLISDDGKSWAQQ